MAVVNTQDPEAGLEELGRGLKAGTPSLSSASPSKMGTFLSFVLNLRISFHRSLVPGSSRRKREVGVRHRRAVANDGTLTTLQVESLMQSYGATFSAAATDADIQKSDADSFFSDMNDYLVGLCKGIETGESAIHAKYTQVASIRVEKKNFAGTADSSADMACTDCPTVIDTSGTFKVGTSLQDYYDEWTCDGNLLCYSACMATYQLPRDLLTVTSTSASPLISNRRSHLMSVGMINPSTHVSMTSQWISLSDPIEIVMPISGAVDLNAYSLKCRQWVSGDWTDSTCISGTPALVGSAYTVTCACNRLAVVGVFEHTPEVISTTTSAPTPAPTAPIVVAGVHTNPPGGVIGNNNGNGGGPVSSIGGSSGSSNTGSNPGNTGNTGNSVNGRNAIVVEQSATSVYVAIKFNHEYLTFVEGRKQAFLDEIKPQLATKMNIQESRIFNMEAVSGSIVLSFEVARQSNTAEITAQAALSLLETCVLDTSCTFQATTNDGDKQNIVTDGKTFDYSMRTGSTVLSASGLTAGAIAGIAVGCLVVVVVIIVIIVICVKSKNSTHKKLDDDEENFGIESNLRTTPLPVPGAPTAKKAFGNAQSKQLHSASMDSMLTVKDVNLQPRASTPRAATPKGRASPRPASGNKIEPINPATETIMAPLSKVTVSRPGSRDSRLSPPPQTNTVHSPSPGLGRTVSTTAGAGIADPTHQIFPLPSEGSIC